MLFGTKAQSKRGHTHKHKENTYYLYIFHQNRNPNMIIYENSLERKTLILARITNMASSSSICYQFKQSKLCDTKIQSNLFNLSI